MKRTNAIKPTIDKSAVKQFDPVSSFKLSKILEINRTLKDLDEKIDKLVDERELFEFKEGDFEDRKRIINEDINRAPRIDGDELKKINKKIFNINNKIEIKHSQLLRKSKIKKHINNIIDSDKASIVGIADQLKGFIPPFVGDWQPKSPDEIIENAKIGIEPDDYSSINIGQNGIGVLGPTGYSKAQNDKIKTAIKYFRFSIPPENPIKDLIRSYQSDPDADDILRSTQDERIDAHMFANYRISRYFNLDPSKPFFSRSLEDTGLGRVADRLMNEEDPDDKFVVGYNRFFNILFGGFVHLVLMALVFPSWPSFMDTENPISVYVGTYSSNFEDANCLNFKLAEIERGEIQPGATIPVYAPVTSASNDANVAIQKFAKQNGSIIKINLANGKSFMCVSTGPNEAETFVLAGEYQYVRKYPFIDREKGTLTVYEFDQLNTPFTGLTSADLTQPYWSSFKKKIPEAIKLSHPHLNPELMRQHSFLRNRTGSYTRHLLKEPIRLGLRVGGSRKSNKRRKTNKRRRTNKRRNSNKRRTKRRI